MPQCLHMDVNSCWILLEDACMAVSLVIICTVRFFKPERGIQNRTEQAQILFTEITWHFLKKKIHVLLFKPLLGCVPDLFYTTGMLILTLLPQPLSLFYKYVVIIQHFKAVNPVNLLISIFTDIVNRCHWNYYSIWVSKKYKQCNFITQFISNFLSLRQRQSPAIFPRASAKPAFTCQLLM